MIESMALAHSWQTVVVLNLALAAVAWRTGAVEWTGAVSGAACGLVMALCGGASAFYLLAVFVVLGSGFTRVGYARKAALGAAQERRGTRTWRNALANCGAGTCCAVLVAATASDAARAALVGAFAAALADTTESELGMLAGRRCWLIPSLRRVPPGTEGAVSLEGSLLGLAAAAAVAALAATWGVMTWDLVVAVTAAAWAGTLLESLLGGGRTWSNELLNTITTTTGAAGAAVLATWLG